MGTNLVPNELLSKAEDIADEVFIFELFLIYCNKSFFISLNIMIGTVNIYFRYIKELGLSCRLWHVYV